MKESFEKNSTWTALNFLHIRLKVNRKLHIKHRKKSPVYFPAIVIIRTLGKLEKIKVEWCLTSPDSCATWNQHQRKISQVFIKSKYEVQKYSAEKMSSDELGQAASSKLLPFSNICPEVRVTFFNVPNSCIENTIYLFINKQYFHSLTGSPL